VGIRAGEVEVVRYAAVARALNVSRRPGTDSAARPLETDVHGGVSRVLVVEDDEALARVLVDNLLLEGFDARQAADGSSAARLAAAFHPDLVILDVLLPDTTGFDLCGALRRRGAVAVIMLTARDKLHGLSLGADDYVTKPFDMDELMLRVRAVLRRARATVDRLTLGETVIDLKLQRASRGLRNVELTSRAGATRSSTATICCALSGVSRKCRSRGP
jgi:CheY-like chemotaxis protein